MLQNWRKFTVCEITSHIRRYNTVFQDTAQSTTWLLSWITLRRVLFFAIKGLVVASHRFLQ